MLSIVVPIFNAAPHVSKTIDSIIQDKNAQLQIILIDDGSTDKSLEISKQYAMMDERIEVIHQTNRGVSSARNTGIRHARGAYLWFVDADDWIAPNVIPGIMKILDRDEPDILFSNVRIFTEPDGFSDRNVLKYNINLIKQSTKDPLLYYLFETLKMGWVVWRHIYRTEFLKEHNRWFDEKLRLFEDSDWLIGTILAASKFSAYRRIIYNYRFDNKLSLTHQEHTLQMFLHSFETSVKWFRFFQNDYFKCEGQRAVMRRLSDDYKRAFIFTMRLKEEDRRTAMQMYMQNIDIANYHDYKKFDKSLLLK